MQIVCKFKILMLMIDFVLALNIALAQQPAVINDSLFSKALNEQRKITICLPEEYKPGSNTRYDVVYIIDGEMHLDDFLFIYKFAKHENFLPPLILIALPNTYTSQGNMRDRDFLPEKTAGIEKAGGADNFIAFLKDELMPYIDKKLPTSGENSLFGHSLGGLFTLYAMYEKPDVFNRYIAISPAVVWDDNYMLKVDDRYAEGHDSLPVRLFLSQGGDEYRPFRQPIVDFQMKLADRNYKEMALLNYTIEGERHSGVKSEGYSRGLRWVFKDIAPTGPSGLEKEINH